MPRLPFPPYAPYAPSAPFPAYPPYPPYPSYPPPIGASGPGGSGPGVTTGTEGTAGAAAMYGGPSGPAPPPTGPGRVPMPSPSPAGPPAQTPPVETPPPHISPYAVAATTLDPVPGWHSGTGVHAWPRLIVDPSSVPPPGNLRFLTAGVRVTTMLFQISDAVVPNWFGVAIPTGTVDFTKPNLFFHPIPAQAGYRDSDYPTKTGYWPKLFYYMERLGSQVDAAVSLYGAPRNQVVIMPFLTSAATDAGILPDSWFGIITDILSDVRFAVAGVGGSPVPISELVVSSYSVGLVYSDSFRRRASGLGPYLKQVWDFDGYPKTLSTALVPPADYAITKYDQGSEPASIHVPLGRWADYPSPPPNPGDPPPPANGSDVHHLIRDFLFLHAATLR